eukprot:jgi/Ulvmu1/5204/UM212_0003.1
MLDYTWERTLCYFGNQEKTLERAYGRVDRSALRHHLLSRCSAAGVTHAKALVTDIDADPHAAVAAVHTSATPPISARLATLAGGAVSAKFLSFESGAPPVAAQTANGEVFLEETCLVARPTLPFSVLKQRSSGGAGRWASRL